MSKVAVIVGVGPGNGAAFARRFTAEGYAVALLARDEARLVEFEKEISGSKAYACDVTEPAEIKAVFAAITADLGPVDMLVYNAGAGSWSTPDETTAEDM
ncbi:MAG: SDR family NAD(P)-dependent oxidoreductase, partial [Sphingomonadales bacterium]|nr:SDR family NAD(P)-dependent oxidoreductase [Sphingomonadales bacterium]